MRTGVLSLITGLFLIAASTVPAGADHQNRPASSYDAVHQSHDVTTTSHDATQATTTTDHGKQNDDHHQNGETSHTHSGHRLLRWLHSLLGRIGHKHNGQHTSGAIGGHDAGANHGIGTGTVAVSHTASHPVTHPVTRHDGTTHDGAPCRQDPLQ